MRLPPAQRRPPHPPLSLPLPLSCLSTPPRQVLAFAAVVTPNQDTAFMVAIAWTAVNLLMSNFMVRYADMTQQWLSQLR